MSKLHVSPTAEYQTECQAQAYLTEFEKLRDEILHSESVCLQTLVLTLASASVILPILVGQFYNISESAFDTLLYALTIIYSVFAMKFANAEFHEAAIGKYLHEYLAPRLNRLLETTTDRKVLQWEAYIRRQRKYPLASYIEAVAASTTLLVMLLPGAAALLIVGFISRAGETKFIPETLIVPAIWLHGLAFITWVCFLASILSVIFVSIYNLTRARIISSRPADSAS